MLYIVKYFIMYIVFDASIFDHIDWIQKKGH